jgi:hypothetical protein
MGSMSVGVTIARRMGIYRIGGITGFLGDSDTSEGKGDTH